MTRTPRTAALLAAAVAAVTVAGPALAADVTTTTPVLVLLSADAPTRTFAVEKVTGGALTTIDLGRGGGQPFRTTVTDADLTGSYGAFDITAEMTDFYLRTGPSSYDFATRIASSEASLEFAGAPSAAGVVLDVLPRVRLSGGVTCSDGPVRSLLDIDPLALLSSLTGPVAAVCDALAAAHAASTDTVVVPALARTIDSTLLDLTDLADLPVALTGLATGNHPFTNASYAPGSVAAGRRGSAPDATTVPIMSGGGAPSSDLLDLVQGAVTSAVAGLPVASETGAGALTRTSTVLDALQDSSSSALQTLGGALAGLTDAGDQLALVNSLTATVLDVTGADLSGIGGTYASVPTLKAAPATVPAAGEYAGTLTVTFIQH